MNKKDFKEWYDDFLSTHGGITVAYTWADKVNKSHTKINQLFGSCKQEYEVSMDDVQKPLPKKDLDKLISSISKIIGSENFKYGMKNMNIGKSDLSMPTIFHDTHKFTKTTKMISKIIDHSGYDSSSKEVGKIISNLGKLWNKYKTKVATLKVVLSTEPKDFVSIGHFKVDSGSCFRQGSGGCRHKYDLGSAKNTFVVLVYDKEDIVCRAWGVWDGECGFHVNNYYFKEGTHDGTVYESIRMVLSNIVKQELNFYEINEEYSARIINPMNIYVNRSGQTFFGIKEPKPMNLDGICNRTF